MYGNLSKRKGMDSSLNNNDIERLRNKLFERFSSEIPTKVSELTNDSGYLTEHQDITGKVDKESGKGLSANDYTDAEKEKLAGLKNYNDTEIKKSIDDINTQIGDIDAASDAILKIQSGLMGGDAV